MARKSNSQREGEEINELENTEKKVERKEILSLKTAIATFNRAISMLPKSEINTTRDHNQIKEFIKEIKQFKKDFKKYQRYEFFFRKLAIKIEKDIVKLMQLTNNPKLKKFAEESEVIIKYMKDVWTEIRNVLDYTDDLKDKFERGIGKGFHLNIRMPGIDNKSLSKLLGTRGKINTLLSDIYKNTIRIFELRTDIDKGLADAGITK